MSTFLTFAGNILAKRFTQGFIAGVITTVITAIVLA